MSSLYQKISQENQSLFDSKRNTKSTLRQDIVYSEAQEKLDQKGSDYRVKAPFAPVKFFNGLERSIEPTPLTSVGIQRKDVGIDSDLRQGFGIDYSNIRDQEVSPILKQMPPNVMDAYSMDSVSVPLYRDQQIKDKSDKVQEENFFDNRVFENLYYVKKLPTNQLDRRMRDARY